MVIHFHSEMAITSISNTLGSSWQMHPMTDAGYPGRMPCGKWLHWLLGLWDILPSRPGCSPKNPKNRWNIRGFCSQRIISPQNMGISWDFSNRTGGLTMKNGHFQQPPKLCRWPPCRPSKNHGPTWSGRCDLGRLVARGSGGYLGGP